MCLTSSSRYILPLLCGGLQELQAASRMEEIRSPELGIRTENSPLSVPERPVSVPRLNNFILLNGTLLSRDLMSLQVL